MTLKLTVRQSTFTWKWVQMVWRSSVMNLEMKQTKLREIQFHHRYHTKRRESSSIKGDDHKSTCSKNLIIKLKVSYHKVSKIIRYVRNLYPLRNLPLNSDTAFHRNYIIIVSNYLVTLISEYENML